MCNYSVTVSLDIVAPPVIKSRNLVLKIHVKAEEFALKRTESFTAGEFVLYQLKAI